MMIKNKVMKENRKQEVKRRWRRKSKKENNYKQE